MSKLLYTPVDRNTNTIHRKISRLTYVALSLGYNIMLSIRRLEQKQLIHRWQIISAHWLWVHIYHLHCCHLHGTTENMGVEKHHRQKCRHGNHRSCNRGIWLYVILHKFFRIMYISWNRLILTIAWQITPHLAWQNIPVSGQHSFVRLKKLKQSTYISPCMVHKPL